MPSDLKPIWTKADHKRALVEVAWLWGAKSGTPDSDRLDRLATLIDVYESEHYLIGTTEAWDESKKSGVADRYDMRSIIAEAKSETKKPRPKRPV